MCQPTNSLSAVIGSMVIATAVFSKVPQIHKIHKNKSGEGINIWSVTMDLVSITTYMAYSYLNDFPFTAWGDAVFLSVQTVVIAALTLAYQGTPAKATAYVTSYLIMCYLLLSGLTPMDLLWTLQSSNIPIYLAGKMMQAHTNFQNGHTGQLSVVTLSLLFFGSSARIYTSVVDTKDPMLIFTNVVGAFANGLLTFQIFYYKEETAKRNKSE